ncbi:MAG: translation initiation factor IF-3 [Phycisphaerales bacterium]|nr:translation initiation factor IF-3 [Phycisphaerales bacterium]
MPISRFSRPGPGGPPQRTRVNHFIRITPIRVVGAAGEQIGVIETPVALKMAEEQGLDLVEISPEARPPVCKIMDFGKFKYELSKQSKNKGAKASELKEVRLGRSVKIDPHDVGIRVKQARRFLLEGNKVQITQRFRGREMAHREIGINRLAEIAKTLAEVGKIEAPPRWNGPQAYIIVAPDKVKCEAIKRAEAKARAEALKRGEKIKEEVIPELPDDDDDDDDLLDEVDGQEGDGPQPEPTAEPTAEAPRPDAKA